jgi:hypothetical protein
MPGLDFKMIRFGNPNLAIPNLALRGAAEAVRVAVIDLNYFCRITPPTTMQGRRMRIAP